MTGSSISDWSKKDLHCNSFKKNMNKNKQLNKFMEGKIDAFMIVSKQYDKKLVKKDIFYNKIDEKRIGLVVWEKLKDAIKALNNNMYNKENWQVIEISCNDLKELLSKLDKNYQENISLVFL